MEDYSHSYTYSIINSSVYLRNKTVTSLIDEISFSQIGSCEQIVLPSLFTIRYQDIMPKTVNFTLCM